MEEKAVTLGKETKKERRKEREVKPVVIYGKSLEKVTTIIAAP